MIIIFEEGKKPVYYNIEEVKSLILEGNLNPYSFVVYKNRPIQLNRPAEWKWTPQSVSVGTKKAPENKSKQLSEEHDAVPVYLCDVKEAIPITELVEKYVSQIASFHRKEFVNFKALDSLTESCLPWCSRFPFWESRVRAIDASTRAMIHGERESARKELGRMYTLCKASGAEPSEIQLIAHNLGILHLECGDLSGLAYLVEALFQFEQQPEKNRLKKSLIALGEVVLTMYMLHKGTKGISRLAQGRSFPPRRPYSQHEVNTMQEEMSEVEHLDHEKRLAYLYLAYDLHDKAKAMDDSWEEIKFWSCPETGGSVRKGSGLCLILDMSLDGDMIIYALHRGKAMEASKEYEWLLRIENSEGNERFHRWFEFLEKVPPQSLHPQYCSILSRLIIMLEKKIMDATKRFTRIKDQKKEEQHFLMLLIESIEDALLAWEQNLQSMKSHLSQDPSQKKQDYIPDGKKLLQTIERQEQDAEWLQKFWEDIVPLIRQLEHPVEDPVTTLNHIHRKGQEILAEIIFHVSSNCENLLGLWLQVLWEGILAEGCVKAGFLEWQESMQKAEIYFLNAITSANLMEHHWRIYHRRKKELNKTDIPSYWKRIDLIPVDMLEDKISNLLFSSAILQNVEEEGHTHPLFRRYTDWLYAQIRKIYEADLTSLHLLGSICRSELEPLNITLDSLELNDSVCISLKDRIISKIKESLELNRAGIPNINEISNMLHFRRDQIRASWEIMEICKRLDKKEASSISVCTKWMFLLAMIYHARRGWEYLSKIENISLAVETADSEESKKIQGYLDQAEDSFHNALRYQDDIYWVIWGLAQVYVWRTKWPPQKVQNRLDQFAFNPGDPRDVDFNPALMTRQRLEQLKQETEEKNPEGKNPQKIEESQKSENSTTPENDGN